MAQTIIITRAGAMRKFKCAIVRITKCMASSQLPAARPEVCYDAVSVMRVGCGQERLMDSHEKDRLFQKGLDAFNSAHFYDAHEHWEEVWLETPNPEKMFLQGLIQVAAAFHHYSRDKSPGLPQSSSGGSDQARSVPASASRTCNRAASRLGSPVACGARSWRKS